MATDFSKEIGISYDDYRYVVKLCKKKIRKAKAQLELNLATKVKDNSKYFYKYINSKRRARENLHPLFKCQRQLGDHGSG